MNRKTRAAARSLGEPHDDAANADADMPSLREHAPPKGAGTDLPDPAPQKLRAGEGPELDDAGADLGPPDDIGN